MELDVSRIRTAPVQDFSREKVSQPIVEQQKTEQRQRKETVEKITHEIKQLEKQIDAEKYFSKIIDIPNTLNRKLSFEIDGDQVVVKVIDSETDKVIKEVPPVELRRMYQRIQEYVGLLIDKTI